MWRTHPSRDLVSSTELFFRMSLNLVLEFFTNSCPASVNFMTVILEGINVYLTIHCTNWLIRVKFYVEDFLVVLIQDREFCGNQCSGNHTWSFYQILEKLVHWKPVFTYRYKWTYIFTFHVTVIRFGRNAKRHISISKFWENQCWEVHVSLVGINEITFACVP